MSWVATTADVYNGIIEADELRPILMEPFTAFGTDKCVSDIFLHESQLFLGWDTLVLVCSEVGLCTPNELDRASYPELMKKFTSNVILRHTCEPSMHI